MASLINEKEIEKQKVKEEIRNKEEVVYQYS